MCTGTNAALITEETKSNVARDAGNKLKTNVVLSSVTVGVLNTDFQSEMYKHSIMTPVAGKAEELT